MRGATAPSRITPPKLSNSATAPLPPGPVFHSTSPEAGDPRWANRKSVLEAFPTLSPTRASTTRITVAVSRNGMSLRFACPELRADREVVLEALRNDQMAFQHADEALRHDRDFVFEMALPVSGWALKHAAEELAADSEVVLKAVRLWGFPFEFAHEDLRNDRVWTMEAVRANPWAFKFCNEEFQADRDIALEAVRNEGFTLQFASRELRSDAEIVTAAIKHDENAKEFVLRRERKQRGPSPRAGSAGRTSSLRR
eukprot:TRINITY_DN16512_c0_g1_i1.p1 TRINITY_DN16512_c0_g1~~TRINITY_DN16512_c0_g1_i1.p1  ORF type:complete len:255 (-),score=35.68 TRINITY_DN16512_c0_g1_i1:69-833(-)